MMMIINIHMTSQKYTTHKNYTVPHRSTWGYEEFSAQSCSPREKKRRKDKAEGKSSSKTMSLIKDYTREAAYE